MKKVVGIIICLAVIVGGILLFTKVSKKESNNSTDENKVVDESKNIKYEYKSNDESSVLKVYELSSDTFSFEYNNATDITLENKKRTLEATVKMNENMCLCYEEDIEGIKYKIEFTFEDSKDRVYVTEYKNDNELGQTILYKGNATKGYNIDISNKDITVKKGETVSFNIKFNNPDITTIREYIQCDDQNDIVLVKYSDVDDDERINVDVDGLKVGETKIVVADYSYPDVKEIVKVHVVE